MPQGRVFQSGGPPLTLIRWGSSRLNGQPNHVLKVAQLFQAALWAETSCQPDTLIEAAVLEKAIEHTEHCLAAAQALDGVANRSEIREDADLLLLRIIKDFKDSGYCEGDTI
jgi:hypothetical protein